jgi:pimeloyl-ACP methyl ester carboxylesterase
MVGIRRTDRVDRQGCFLAIVAIVLALAGAQGGCAPVATRRAVVLTSGRNALDRARAELPLRPESRAVLARYQVRGTDPLEAAEQLESRLQTSGGADPAAALTLAELWIRVAARRRHHDPALAVCAFRDAAAAAALSLRDCRSIAPERAIELHNEAVAEMLELTNQEAPRGNARWNEYLAGMGVTTRAVHDFVDPARFERVGPTRNVRVTGMQHRYVGPGLGVPVVALRPNDREHPTEPSAAYFPKKLAVGATVVAVPGGTLADGSWRTAALSLTFVDPFQSRSVQLGGQSFAMAYDTSTALAFQASQRILSVATLAGLLVSDFQSGIEPGLYMLRTYQPGKIPVVFIHGLNSNPAAFVQAINELRNDPEVSERYQFLLFAYPTGRPIPASAARLRQALYDAESRFGSDPMFHQMVLVGHSMGGNLSKFMVTDSGMALWNAILTVPPDQLRVSEPTRAKLTEALIFKPVPFVKRAVFIATPHQGSRLADEPIGRIVSRVMRPASGQTEWIEELIAAHGPGVFRENVFRARSVNSIGNLSPRSPVLQTLDQLPCAPGVSCHTIQFRFLGVLPTDLVVPEWSSTHAGVQSALALPGIHTSEQRPGVIEELRRILLDPVAAPAGVVATVAP